MIKQIGHWKILLLLMAAMSVNVRVSLAQNVRFDYIALTTTGAGQAVPLLALPGTGVSFYTCTAGVCTTLANTYPSASSTTVCPTSAQVVLALDTTCVSTADFQGNFGAWFLPGQYAYALLIAGVTYGPYPFTIGGGTGGSGTVGSGTAGQIAQYPANGTSVTGVTVSGDATLANGGALTFKTVNSNVGNCGDATHVGVSTLNAKGLTTACSPVAISFPPGGATLQTNGTNNASQTTLNLSGGSGITVTNPSAGNVFITNTVVPPASAVVLGSNSSGQLVNAAVQGNGTKVQLSTGTTTTGDVVSYDANGNAIDSTVALANLPRLNTNNTWTALNQFSTQMNVSTGTATGLFVTPTNVSGQSAGSTTFQLDLGTGIAAFGISAGGQSTFNINPNGSVGGKNAGTQEWSISNVTGAAVFKSLSATSTIVNGAGLQIATATACATTGTLGAGCSVTVPLPITEPDTAYQAYCSVDGSSSDVILGQWGAATTTNFVFRIISTAAASSGGTIQCLVTHN